MYRLFIANKNYSSWSLRPWLLMRVLGIEFEELLTPFDGSAHRDRFRAISPSAKMPCLVDGATTVWDSLAIAEYLAERHAGVWPRESGARAWARCAAAEMHSGFSALRSRCSMCCGIRVRLNGMPEELRLDVERIGRLWAEGLARFGGPFLGGSEFGAVDAFYAPVAFRAQSYGLDFGKAGASYIERLLGLDAMRSWYADALRESWRDAEHEVEVRAAGTVLEDMRAPLVAD